MRTVKITPEVAHVLRTAEITSTSVKLKGQLEALFYRAVMKVIDAQGGKWSRKEGCHIFPSDPRQIFASALNEGKIVHAKKSRQAFYTPESLAERVVDLAGIKKGQRVLEPSAGDGAIAKVLATRRPEATRSFLGRRVDRPSRRIIQTFWNRRKHRHHYLPQMTPEEKTALLLTLSSALEFCRALSSGSANARRNWRKADQLSQRLNEAIAIANRMETR